MKISIDIDQIQSLLSYQVEQPMLFNSGLFLIFFLVLYGGYLFLRQSKSLRIIYLLLFSLFFYYKSSGYYFIILIASTLFDYVLGMGIDRAKLPWQKKLGLALSLLGNLGLLAYFKYTNFFIEQWNQMQGGEIAAMDIFLPVGISFYTFQTMSYSIDVYRGKLKASTNLLDFAFYVCFFPQLIAGPIVRAAEFIPQIRQKFSLNETQIGKALWLIMGGLLKKAVISDYISVNFVDRIFENPLLYSSWENLLAVYGYAVQIYCDFSGYSDMAIGLALLLGFKIPDNFNSPYRAASITDFWRRWHISLSTWLKDYLYISLGGNRKGAWRTYFNLMITMLLGGLWHGASWKFVAWGAMHGAFLSIEKAIGWHAWTMRAAWKRALGIFITFHLVCICWVFFRAENFAKALEVFQSIAAIPDWSLVLQITQAIPQVLTLIGLGMLLHFIPNAWDQSAKSTFARSPGIIQALLLALCMWVVFQVSNSAIQPFIYFQF